MASEHTHTGHRERLKSRFLQQGLGDVTEIQALELRLCYANPRGDTNPTAHALLERCGSLSQVLEAPMEELKKVSGIGDHGAVLLKLVVEMGRFYQVDCAQRVPNPRGDTNPTAHALLERFGSLSQVLEAPMEELKKVSGIGDHGAVLLKLVVEMGRFYQVDCAQRVQCLTTLDACGAYLVPYFFGRTQETVFLRCLDAKCKVLCCQVDCAQRVQCLTTLDACGAYLVPYFFGRTQETVFLRCLDAKCKVLCCPEVGQGSVNSASISVRNSEETALNARATTVVLAHNHPSGVALPSSEDVQTTRRVAAALAAVEVHLADHTQYCGDGAERPGHHGGAGPQPSQRRGSAFQRGCADHPPGGGGTGGGGSAPGGPHGGGRWGLCFHGAVGIPL